MAGEEPDRQVIREITELLSGSSPGEVDLEGVNSQLSEKYDEVEEKPYRPNQSEYKARVVEVKESKLKSFENLYLTTNFSLPKHQVKIPYNADKFDYHIIRIDDNAEEPSLETPLSKAELVGSVNLEELDANNDTGIAL